MVQNFNKSDPCEPINPSGGVQSMFSAFGKIAGEALGVQTGPGGQMQGMGDIEYFESFESSLPFIKKFVGKNVLITGATGGIGS